MCSSCYSLWTDDGNCLLSYLDAHTKGDPWSSKMNKQLWKHSHVCFTSYTINKYTFFTGWFPWKNQSVLPWLLTAFFLSFSLSSPLTPSPSLNTPIASNDSNMHSCSLRGRAFKIYCYKSIIKSLNTTGTVQHFVCCPCCSWISPLHCVQPQQFWLILRVWLTGGRLSDVSQFKWVAALWSKEAEKTPNNKYHVTCCYSDRWPLGAMWIADSPRCLNLW